eukprot:GHVP01013412.1.p1 GENE.GHVP01013412.1~~GHVP01013412.1.p1  ORF type:complete len:751 (+),score=152.11 GHVP01013412.1:26-2278(+)
MNLNASFWLFFLITKISNLVIAVDIDSQEILNNDKTNAVSHPFKAEVTRLMDIIINSLYSQKEVFIREVISNSADALEKARFVALSHETESDLDELAIDISFDREKKLFSIKDNGIGMSERELVENLGSIAHSGSMRFLESIPQGQSADINLIGQFGVGFYSVFLVADRVSVISRSLGNDQYVWESSADGTFTVFPDPRGNTMKHGTEILLEMKDDALSLLSESQITSQIKKFSQFTSFPVYLKTENKSNDEDESEETEKWKRVLINTEKPIWLRSKTEVEDDEYKSFYKVVSKDHQEPLSWVHFQAEGEIEFKSILYVPRSGRNFFHGADKEGMKLFVRRVLVSESSEDLLPSWLGWVKGVVDSDDLPLKVDREKLSQSRVLKVIQKRLTKKLLELFKKMSNEDLEMRNRESEDLKDKSPSPFTSFYNEYRQALKYGCVEDGSNRDKIFKLLRFSSSRHPYEMIPVEQYVSEMPENQPSIYFISGSSAEALKHNPNLQAFLKRGYDVLFLTDALDEPCFDRMEAFEEKALKNVEKGDVLGALEEDQELKIGILEEMYAPLLTWWKEATKDRIRKVQISKRLVDDPVSIVTEAWGTTGFSEKVLKAQGVDIEYSRFMGTLRNLEVNPNHPIVQELLEKVQSDPSNEILIKTANNLVDTALLASGYEVQDMSGLTNQVYRSILIEMGKNPDSVPKEFEITEDQIEEFKTRKEEKKDSSEPDENSDFDFENFDWSTIGDNININDEIEKDEL